MTDIQPLQPAPTIANLAMLVSRGYRVGEMGFTAMTDDGHQFVTISDAGLIERMGGFREGPEHETEEAAVLALLAHLEDYKLKTPGGLIRWRRLPEAMKNTDTGLWRAGCRLVISDDPESHLGQQQRKHAAGMLASGLLAACMIVMMAGASIREPGDWPQYLFAVIALVCAWRFEENRKAYIGPEMAEPKLPW